MTKEEILKLYLSDLKNLLPDSNAKRSRIIDLEEELECSESENERLKSEREWISVEDRLPEIGQLVLTYVPCIDMICRDQYMHFEGINKNDFVYKGVSHWMPLPQPPKQ